MSFASGMVIGKYELGKKLGQGGFGLVFVARDSGLDRDVALKLMHPEHTANPEILRRFLQEARSAAKIVHPGIVTVFECGQVPGSGAAFIAMELLHGESLADRLARSGKLSAESAIEIARQVASALEAAHREGIVHRDLKPDNIFLVKDPAMPRGERVKVLDFGIAKLAAGTSVASSGVQTQSMMVFGTPRYMSPEQCRSAAHVDHRSDIYTLGCILFELVCGRPVFEGELGELIAKHQLIAPPDARTVADVPPGLAELTAAMLAKKPGERPQSMREVEEALDAGGVRASAVAPTLLPDAADSLPRASRPIAAATPTTLSSATGPIDAPRSPPHRRGLAFMLGGGAALVAGVAIWVAVHRGDDAVAPAAAAAPAPAPAPAAPPPPPVAPPQPQDVELELAAIPKAEVYLAADGRLLGETPYKLTRTPADGQIVFLLKADGYRDERVVMAANKSDARTITLTAIEKPAAATVKPAAKPKPVAKPSAPQKPGDQIEVYK